MPRIRTLKPEHKQHRKVGLLTDRQYRLWVGMITEADDEGRLVADPAQLRVLIFAYQPRTTVRHVAEALEALAAVGLLRLYRAGEVTCAEFCSWKDHQRVERPTASKFPPSLHSESAHLPLTEDAVMTPEGSEGIGRDQGREGITTSPFPPAEPALPPSPTWGKPEHLVSLYNRLCPNGHPRVTRISPGRNKKAREYLTIFPEQAFWMGVFSELGLSRFLQHGSKDSPAFKGDFDWLLTKGKDGSENAVKVFEGKYRDKEHA